MAVTKITRNGIVGFASALVQTTEANAGDNLLLNASDGNATNVNGSILSETDNAILVLKSHGIDFKDDSMHVESGSTLKIDSGATITNSGTSSGFGATISNDANNRVITADGSEGLNGEANLTFDGTTLAVTGTVEPAGDTAAGDNAAIGYTSAEGLILTGQGSTDDITIKNDADTTVVNVATGGTDVEISAGNIVMGTASKGIYLGVTSATAANLLDDYEEGIYVATVTCSSSGNYVLDTGYDTIAYTKIGNMVHIVGYINVSSENSPNGTIKVSLPFAPVAMDEYAGSGYTRGGTIVGHADGTASSNVMGWFDSSEGAFMPFYEETHATGAVTSLQHDHADTVFSISVNATYFA